MCKNGGIYGGLGTWWVLITMATGSCGNNRRLYSPRICCTGTAIGLCRSCHALGPCMHGTAFLPSGTRAIVCRPIAPSLPVTLVLLLRDRYTSTTTTAVVRGCYCEGAYHRPYYGNASKTHVFPCVNTPYLVLNAV